MMSSAGKPTCCVRMRWARCADRQPALERVGLALLVERHDHGCGAVAAHLAGVLDEYLFALLEADRVDDRLALHALQPRLDHRPLGGVDHHRHARDVGLGGHQMQQARHGSFRVQHALVHVDVDHLGAARNLLAGDVKRGAVVAGLDQLAELGGAGDVGALADVDEQAVLVDVEWLQSRQAALDRLRRHAPRGAARKSRVHQPDVLGGRAAAAADDVHQPRLAELAQDFRGLGRRLVVFAEGIRQPGVRIGAHVGVGDPRELGDVRAQRRATERAVEADAQRLRVADRIPERLGRLAREQPAGGVGDGSRDRQRQRHPGLIEQRQRRVNGGLGVQRVDHGLYQQQIGTAKRQRACRVQVGGDQLIEADAAVAGVVHVG